MPDATQAAYGFSYGLDSIPIFSVLALFATLVVYVRGWLALRASRPEEIPFWRLGCFSLGMLSVVVAIASPLDIVSGVSLTAHMIQHLLLMAIAPPLLVLGSPMVPMLRGLPRWVVREGLGPLFVLRPVHWLERLFASRLFAWLLMNVTFVGWHTPALYDLALRNPTVHEWEHITFLLTSVLFWWHVVAPWPTVYGASRWLLLPFLLTSDFLNTGISAMLSLSGRVVYPVYAEAPQVFGMTALADQIAAGSLMWVIGSVSFLGAAMLITVQIMSRSGERARRMREEARARIREMHRAGRAGSSGVELWLRRLLRVSGGGTRKPVVRADGARGRRDLLRIAWIGRLLTSRYGRQSLQAASLLIAAAVIADGLFGHQMGSMNLAGIIPWTYARGIFVFALLLAGNLFCMSCPFMLPREVGKWVVKRLGFAGVAWPRALRNKWLPAGLVVLFFWAYEALDLWNSPMRSAVLLLAYFLTAFAVDAVFRDASFCKYVCPLGQFNFAASLLSPVEVAPRSMGVCGSCSTRDCIAGHVPAQKSEVVQRGCELHLFLPGKSGNMDCTLCMDCVKACPHDNVGLFVGRPALDLVQLATVDPQRAGVGRYSQRMDVAVLALVVIAAAFASAAVMTEPVGDLLVRVGAGLSPVVAQTAGLGAAFVLPALLLAALAGALLVMKPAGGLRQELPRWALALLPVGFGMWAGHLSFHLVTAWNSIVPGVLGAAHTFGLHGVPRPDWSIEQPLVGADSLAGLQLGLLDFGLLGSLYLGWRFAGAQGSLGGRMRYLLPWISLAVALYALGAWLLLLPMQMRGMVGM